MAKDTAVRLVLNQALINSLTFQQPIIGVDDKGKPVIDPGGPGDRRDWSVRDAGMPGFSVRVYPSKAVYQVTRKMGMRQGDNVKALKTAPIKRKVGDTATMKLDEARRTAGLWLGQMGQGVDPHRKLREKALAEAAQDEKDSLTFGKYYEIHAADSSGIKNSTLEDRKKVIAWMEGSPIWNHSIHILTKEVVLESMQPLFEVAKGKLKKCAWGGPNSTGLATAWKIYRHMAAAHKSFLATLGIEEIRGISPFSMAKKKGAWPPVAEKGGYLDLTEEKHILWLKSLVDARDHIDPGKQVMADFLITALILGGRKNEIQLLEWEHLDFAKRTGFFPAENRKVEMEYWFPLTSWLIEIFEQRRVRNREWGRDEKWVFPSAHHGKPLKTYRTLTTLLKDQSGIWLTAHDMRRTAATDVAAISKNDMFVAMQLGHTKTKTDVTMRYVQGRLRLMRPLIEQRERNLREAVGLATGEEQVSPIDALIEFLREGKKDPSQRVALETKVGSMLLLLKD